MNVSLVKMFTSVMLPTALVLGLTAIPTTGATAVASHSGPELVFTRIKSGKEHVFYIGEPVHCITKDAPRRLVRGTLEEITEEYVVISGDRVSLDDIDRFEKRGTPFDNLTTALLFISLGLLVFGGLVGIVSALAGGTGGSWLAVVFLVLVGSLIAKIIRSYTNKKAKRVGRKWRVSTRNS